MTDDRVSYNLEAFDRRTFSFRGQSKQVYVKGTGPGVIIMAEMPGIHPLVIRFAERVQEAGFQVWLPSLFGDDGRPATQGYLIKTMIRTCIRREFKALAAHRSSPVTDWLRDLAREVHGVCGGPGVGAVGMCFTGNFALNLMLEPAVVAPILSQPSLPLTNPAGLHIEPEALKQVKARLIDESLTVRAYRFEGDPFCTAQRFEAYEAALGEAFEPRVLPDSAANPDAGMPPHSVVTHHLIDQRGQPTFEALEDMIGFLQERLRPA